MKPIHHEQAHAQLNACIIRALRRAENSGIDVNLYQLSRQWICAVAGEVVHVNDLPKVVDAAIAKLERKEAA